MTKDYTGQIRAYLQQEKDVIDRLDYAAISDVMNILEETRERGGIVYICGNGGSAATASHFVNDFNKGVSAPPPPLKKYQFICLNDNVPMVTAIANDEGYERVFVNQIEGRIKKGDLFIAVSGSGNSKNILLAAEYARAAGVSVIGVTGYDGGGLYQLADYHLHAPVDNMQIVEDAHMIFDHAMMWILTHGSR